MVTISTIKTKKNLKNVYVIPIRYNNNRGFFLDGKNRKNLIYCEICVINGWTDERMNERKKNEQTSGTTH